MARWIVVPVVAAAALSACVTINVYFPAAEAKEAAREFVEKVIGDEVQAQPAPGSGGSAFAQPRPLESIVSLARRVDLFAVVGIGAVHAQAPDITIKTPAIQAIQARMAQRFDSALRAGFDAGALGFEADGTIVVRDAAKLALKDRVTVNSAVAADNRDREAVYREVAVANGHPEWESRIRDVFARQWIESARDGWWYQAGGSWKQK